MYFDCRFLLKEKNIIHLETFGTVCSSNAVLNFFLIFVFSLESFFKSFISSINVSQGYNDRQDGAFYFDRICTNTSSFLERLKWHNRGAKASFL